MIYFNTLTKDYPLFSGDIKLIDPNWNEGATLPPHIVEVEESEPINVLENQDAIPDLPKLENGVWKTSWKIVTYTEEEMIERKNHQEMLLNLVRNPNLSMVSSDNASENNNTASDLPEIITNVVQL